MQLQKPKSENSTCAYKHKKAVLDGASMSKTEERREGTCCWPSHFDHKISKLHCSYWRLKLLQGSYVAMSGLEGVIVILLLLDTPIECDFTPFYQTRVVPVQVVMAMLVQIGSGLLTDLTAVRCRYSISHLSSILVLCFGS